MWLFVKHRWHHVDTGEILLCHHNVFYVGGLRLWGMCRIWSRSWFWHGSQPDSGSDMVVAQTLVLLWLWPRLSFWCGLGLQRDKAFLLQCFLSAVLECRPQLRLNNWLLLLEGWGGVEMVGWGSTCAHSISATDENLKMHLTTLEYLLTLEKKQLVVLNRHFHCLSGDQHILFTVLSRNRTFRSKVIRDMMWWTEVLMSPDLK